MLDDSDDIDTISHAAQDAREAFNDVLAQRPSKHAVRAAAASPNMISVLQIQASRDLKGATKLVGLLLADYINVRSRLCISDGDENNGKSRHARDDGPSRSQKPAGPHGKGFHHRRGEDHCFPGLVRAPEGYDTGKTAPTFEGHWHPIYARAEPWREHDRVGCQNRQGRDATSGKPRVPSHGTSPYTYWIPT